MKRTRPPRPLNGLVRLLKYDNVRKRRIFLQSRSPAMLDSWHFIAAGLDNPVVQPPNTEAARGAVFTLNELWRGSIFNAVCNRSPLGLKL